MRKSITAVIAALALLVSGTAASALTKEQQAKVTAHDYARFAGRYCPGLLYKERDAIADLGNLTPEEIRNADLDTTFMFGYYADREGFCRRAMVRFGPNGDYGFQLLWEVK